jgi:hypothetical protein
MSLRNHLDLREQLLELVSPVNLTLDAFLVPLRREARY